MDPDSASGYLSALDKFNSSFIVMVIISAILNLLLVLLICKRRKRLKENEAFTKGQDMIVKENSDFVMNKIGMDLKEKLI